MSTPFVDIVTIGTELVRGEIADTNAAWIGEQLYLRGFSVGRITTVDDDMDRMTAALQEAAARSQAVIVSGGLGPTVDDITAAAAAQVCGVALRRDEEAVRQMAERLASVGLAVTPNNEKQADVPEGATVLYNDAGTAPGFATPGADGRAPMYFLPGVPRELKRMFTRQVLPALEADHPRRSVVVSRRLRLFGTGESKIDFMLKKQVEQFAGGEGTEVSFRASWPEILVTLRARGATEEEARPRVDAAVAQCRDIVGQYLYGEGNVTLAATVGQALRERGWTLAAAESCTGGGLSAMITDEPGSSDYFLGGVVAYANAVKESLLGVPADTLAEHGAVSDPVARQMALGIRARLGADVGVGITGIAGPGGGSDDKPVGTVHIAVAAGAATEATRFAEAQLRRVFRGTRQMVRRIASFIALAMILAQLREDFGPVFRKDP